MKWKDIFEPVKHISGMDAEDYINDNDPGSYQLVDVRQPDEYEKGHLPGAILLPLSELLDGKGDLDKDKPTLVYCHSGKRSMAAVQFMATQDYLHLLNIQSGYAGWLGEEVDGGYYAGLDLIPTNVTFDDAYQMAWAMEDGLYHFYEILAQRAKVPEIVPLLKKMASFEELHKDQLVNRYSHKPDESGLATNAEEALMEGGYRVGDYLDKVDGELNNVHDVLGLAMAIETQAYDYYSRLSHLAESQETKDLFLGMAQEEKEHLKFIAAELDS